MWFRESFIVWLFALVIEKTCYFLFHNDKIENLMH